MLNRHYLFIFDDIKSTVRVSIYPKVKAILMIRYRGLGQDIDFHEKQPVVDKVRMTMWDIVHFADVVRGSELIRQALGGPFGLHIDVDYALRDDFEKLFIFCDFFAGDM